MPLVSIIKKQLSAIHNNSLKNLKLKLILYTFTLKYVPGKYMYIADMPSRNFIKKRIEDNNDINDVACDKKRMKLEFLRIN